MASVIALRNGVVSKLVKRLPFAVPVSRPVPAPFAAATTTRSFNTSALRQVDGDDRAFERRSDYGHRSDFPCFQGSRRLIPRRPVFWLFSFTFVAFHVMICSRG